MAARHFHRIVARFSGKCYIEQCQRCSRCIFQRCRQTLSSHWRFLENCFPPFVPENRQKEEAIKELGPLVSLFFVIVFALFIHYCNIEKIRQARKSKYVGTNLHPVVSFNSLLSLLTLKMKGKVLISFSNIQI